MASSESESHPSIHSPPKWSLHSSFLRRRIPQQSKTSPPSDVTSSIRCPSPSSLSSPTQPHNPRPSTHHGGRPPPPISPPTTPPSPPQSWSRQCLLSILSLLRLGLRPEVQDPGSRSGPRSSHLIQVFLGRRSPLPWPWSRSGPGPATSSRFYSAEFLDGI